MAEPGRLKRHVPGPSSTNGALKQLQELRRTKAKHASVYEVKEEQPVYDVVDDDDYADIVAKRRREGGNVIDLKIRVLLWTQAGALLGVSNEGEITTDLFQAISSLSNGGRLAMAS